MLPREIKFGPTKTEYIWIVVVCAVFAGICLVGSRAVYVEGDDEQSGLSCALVGMSVPAAIGAVYYFIFLWKKIRVTITSDALLINGFGRKKRIPLRDIQAIDVADDEPYLYLKLKSGKRVFIASTEVGSSKVGQFREALAKAMVEESADNDPGI